MELRPYQIQAHDRTMECFQRVRSVLLVLSTGLGKTIIFAHIANDFLQTGRVMVMAHREELIRQGQEKLELITGCDVELEMGSSWANRGYWGKAPIVVTSVQTQIAGRDGGRMTDFDPDDFSLLVIDEAHHATASSYRKVIEHYSQNPNLRILGVTATPDRTDEMALGQIFDEVAFDYGIREGIDDGWLVPILQQSVFVDGLDYSRCKTQSGDFNQRDLAAVMEFEENLHGIVSPTLELTGDRRTLIFAASVAHAERISEIINRHKPGTANYVTGTTPKDIRRQMFADYAEGKFQYLVNVGVATEGFDEPGIQFVIMARPTKSRCLYTQMAGRGTRPLTGIVENIDEAVARKTQIHFSDKPKLTIVDFVGNCGKHKLMTSADILGGKYEDNVIELAKRNAEKKEGPVDIATELEKAEAEMWKRMKAARDAETRRALSPSAKYSTAEVNPFDLFDLQPIVLREWDKRVQPTEPQLKFFKRNGLDPSGLCRKHASQIIGAKIEESQNEPPSPKQIARLKQFGYATDISRHEAGKIMGQLAANGWRKPA